MLFDTVFVYENDYRINFILQRYSTVFFRFSKIYDYYKMTIKQ